jgi:hypothetical protein
LPRSRAGCSSSTIRSNGTPGARTPSAASATRPTSSRNGGSPPQSTRRSQRVHEESDDGLELGQRPVRDARPDGDVPRPARPGEQRIERGQTGPCTRRALVASEASKRFRLPAGTATGHGAASKGLDGGTGPGPPEARALPVEARDAPRQ